MSRQLPAEERFRAHFLKLASSKEPAERQRAAAELSKFPGDETEAALRALLKDQTENVWLFSADTITKIEYGVRAAAYTSLKSLGKDVPAIVLERQPTDQERHSLRESHWRGAFNEALASLEGAGGWKVISVEDSGTQRTNGREVVAVMVTLGLGDSRCKLTLIPKESSGVQAPIGENLGINGRNSQGARYFYVDGELPAQVKSKISSYFGLQRD